MNKAGVPRLRPMFQRAVPCITPQGSALGPFAIEGPLANAPLTSMGCHWPQTITGMKARHEPERERLAGVFRAAAIRMTTPIAAI